MRNLSLIKDYYIRSGHRLGAVRYLMTKKSYADVVRESQEVVELLLKALVRFCNIEVPRLHDLSDVLIENETLLPKAILEDLQKITKISKQLRRDRELAFYGTEDLTPGEFYKLEDAKEALDNATFVYEKLKFLEK